MKKLLVGLIVLVVLVSIPMAATAEDVDVVGEIEVLFSCTVDITHAPVSGIWTLTPSYDATGNLNTQEWGHIIGGSNYDWSISAAMTPAYLVQEEDINVNLADNLQISTESWQTVAADVNGWSHSADWGAVEFERTWDEEYTFEQTVYDEEAGFYSNTATFTCVNDIVPTDGGGA